MIETSNLVYCSLLLRLNSVKNYIVQNQHLPNIPSVADVTKDILRVTTSFSPLLKKDVISSA